MFMAAVDQTLLATATPAIAASLGGLRDTSWIAVSYLLASATVVPVYGRLGDRRGRRDMLLVALAIFVLGSLACGAAQSLPQLVAARVLQGLGGGGLMTLSQALIGEIVPPRERVRFQAYFALVFTSSSIGGPVLGGLVVSHASWRWLFLANLPLGVLAAWRLLRVPKGEGHPPRAGGMDLAGHVLFAAGALALLYWLTSGGHRFAWSSPQSYGLCALAIACLGMLVVNERRQAAPFLPVELLAEKTIGLSAVLVVCFAACLFSMIFFLPIYLQLGHHLSAQSSGLLLLPVTAGMVTGSMGSSRVLSRTGRPHWIPVAGMALSSAALLALAILPPDVYVVVAMGFLTGTGFGTVMPTSQVVMQTLAGRSRLGAATSIASLARSTGGAAGAALFGAIVFAFVPNADRTALDGGLAESELAPVVRAFHHGFLCVAALAALAAFTASRIPPLTLWPAKPGRGNELSAPRSAPGD
ncbi:MAG: MFS transporter [Betaproteobacteria bacterium]|nr:MFS transporter [Betaproteobacteria bacterium]